MSEVLFYHLEQQTLEQALPLLLDATMKRGWKAVVQAGSAERVAALDSHLWTFRDDAFLPHAAKGDARFAEHADSQPIWLTDEDETPNSPMFCFSSMARNALRLTGLSARFSCLTGAMKTMSRAPARAGAS